MIDASTQELANGVALPDGKATNDLLRMLQKILDKLNELEDRVEVLEP